jgi:DNA-binding winged helix-turn-helix (wHTH) protein
MPARAYRFGAFRLDIDKRELWRADACVSLQPKVFDTLAYLLEHRDAAVSRDELIGAVWGRADVTDNVLGQIIARARHAVDDTGEDQRAIRTVVRFGYRWVAAVEPIAEPAEVPAPVAASASPPAVVDAAASAAVAGPAGPDARLAETRRAPWASGRPAAIPGASTGSPPSSPGRSPRAGSSRCAPSSCATAGACRCVRGTGPR